MNQFLSKTIGFVCCMLAISGQAAERPNVVVIMTDDLGFSDIGCYGSEIETPHLDRLAADGVRFSQFYNTAKCHSSRVSLLTGQYCIAAGDTALTHAVTSAEVLRDGGYFTAMTGKWHLKREPTDVGFDRYFGHLSGACNYFAGDKTFRLNGQPWKVPEDGFYTTVADVDYALRFLNEARQTENPWYLYVAFNAPHAPLHALPEDYAKYKGRYQQGWDTIRDARLAKQMKLGLFPEGLQPSPRPEHVPAWKSLSEWQRNYESNRMATIAAMIDRVDQEVGRLVDDLRANGELENTMILFVSDNGACPYDRKPPKLDVEPTNAETSLGDSTGWAWARNGPFRYYKQNQFEGGISTPAIVHWPAGLKRDAGSIIRQPAHLIDVLPTIADITGSKIPDRADDRELRPVSGVSLRPLFEDQPFERNAPIHLLFSRDRGLRDGDWKIVSFQSSPWELYNVATDRTELNDLAASEPERLKAMIATWTDMARDVLHVRANFKFEIDHATLPHRHHEWTNFEAKTPSDYVKRKKTANTGRARGGPPNAIRARKNTELKIVGRELRLQFNGDDPGIAMDLRSKNLAAGPYKLTFRLRVDAGQAKGELFYTTDPRTTLPKGQRETFDVRTDGQWQQVTIELPTNKVLHQLRVDVSEGAGKATIADLTLSDIKGTELLAWPPSELP